MLPSAGQLRGSRLRAAPARPDSVIVMRPRSRGEHGDASREPARARALMAGHQTWLIPPSTVSSTPAIKLLSPEARNSTAFATFLRAADPADRDDRGQMLLDLVYALAGEIRETVRVGRAWADRVDPDAALLQFDRQRARQRPDRGLARVIDAVPRRAVARRDRRHQDDRRPVVQQRQRFLDGEVGAAERQADGGIEPLWRDIGDPGRASAAPGVGDEHVDVAPASFDDRVKPLEVGRY